MSKIKWAHDVCSVSRTTFSYQVDLNQGRGPESTGCGQVRQFFYPLNHPGTLRGQQKQGHQNNGLSTDLSVPADYKIRPLAGLGKKLPGSPGGMKQGVLSRQVKRRRRPHRLNAFRKLGGHHLPPVNPAPIDNECSVTNSVNCTLLLACGIDVCGYRL